MIPDGLFGGDNKSSQVDQLQSNAAAAQMQTMSVSPREPEEFTRYVQQIFQQVMPAIEFHDDIMKSITEAIEKIPVLPKMIEQLEDQLSVFVFSIIAPFVVPLIDQIKNELRTGSDEIIDSSEKEQHNVFYDDSSSDPTHSMLSKDHFSNVRIAENFYVDGVKKPNLQLDLERGGRTRLRQDGDLGRASAYGCHRQR